MTKQELINTAKNKGFNVILQSDDFYNYIGVQTKRGNVYYWFRGFNDSDNIYFYHRYSQNNGKKSSSFNVGYNFILKLSK